MNQSTTPPVRPVLPMVESNRVVRCAAHGCRSTNVRIKSSYACSNLRVNHMQCLDCHHQWRLAGGLGRILVLEEDGIRKAA